jgi:hypothetical protein
MAGDSCGVMGMLWGLLVGVHVSWSAEFGPGTTMPGGAAGGSSQSSVVRVVAKVQACVPGGDDAPLADLQIGIVARICRLASTMPTIMSCSSSRLCNARTHRGRAFSVKGLS